MDGRRPSQELAEDARKERKDAVTTLRVMQTDTQNFGRLRNHDTILMNGSTGSGKFISLPSDINGATPRNGIIFSQMQESNTIDLRGEPGGAVEGRSCSSSGQDVWESYWQALHRCLAASTKGFAVGAGLRGGLALFSILSRLKRRSASLTSNADLRGKTNNKAIVAALKETLRYGLFLGTFSGAFCTVDEAIAAVGGSGRTARWRALVAGAVAGPALLLTGSKTGHTSLALYVLLRAAVLAARCGIKSERAGWMFRPLSWKHGDTFLMCLSSAQILSAWILKPGSLPSSYVAFLNKHSGKDRSIIEGFRELAFNIQPRTFLKTIEQHYKTNNQDIQLDPHMSIPCTMVHGNEGCVSHFFSHLWASYLRALPVYLPVYLVPALLVHRQGLFARGGKTKKVPKIRWHGRDEELSYDLDIGGEYPRPSASIKDALATFEWPLPILSKMLLGTARSSLFLAMYCASSWTATCAFHRASGKCNPPILAAACSIPGLATLLEKKSRRMELALYCLVHAIESFSTCIADSGLLRRNNLTPPKRMDVLLFSLATGIIMHCYAQEREVFRSKYRNVLDWVFGLPEGATPYVYTRPTKDPVKSNGQILDQRQQKEVEN